MTAVLGKFCLCVTVKCAASFFHSWFQTGILGAYEVAGNAHALRFQSGQVFGSVLTAVLLAAPELSARVPLAVRRPQWV